MNILGFAPKIKQTLKPPNQPITEVIGRSKKIESVPIGSKYLMVDFFNEERIMTVGSYCLVKCCGVLMKIRIKTIKI